MPLRRRFMRRTKRSQNQSQFQKRKFPLQKKNFQSKYELRQPTARSLRTAQQSQLYQTPLWPASKLIKGQLYYDYAQTLTGTAGVMAARVYTANGVFDPDTTGVGHQPIGFDQVIAAYNHYSVIRAKITVTFLNNGDSPVRCGVYLNPESTAVTDPAQLMENGLIKTATCDAKSIAAGERMKTISIDCDVKRYFGKGKYSELLEATYSGTALANPTEQVYFIVFQYNPFDATNTSVKYDAVISYDTIYHEPRKLATS